ncbi:MAG: tRNA (adenosine(37)-N6)-threonylcarbamoyltransferase complex transferase subunit TsaD [Candidatus Omnitrophica bacterium]|nr:tRNA (adenosine(37)-N6)-threonylcarbamoyltransferase complex transferase subunit TsaD [Candidatus Omnitrophota bacterium]
MRKTSVTRILGIETSCDETAIGVVDDGRRILGHVLASSQEFHRPYGGVIPEIAARVHVEVIWQVLEAALAKANCSLDEIDAVAVTSGPGLPGALLIGVAFAKGLAMALDRPLLGVNHLTAHLYAGEMHQPDVSPPYIGLVISGGHTLLCVVHPGRHIEPLGETKDDAVGEAFDKVAKLLDLGYPGGPVIDRLSSEGRADAVPFPRHHTKGSFDFSFSGLKTAVYHHVRDTLAASRESPPAAASRHAAVADVAASFQEAAVDMVVVRALRACHRTGFRTIVVGGGVAANRRLRQRLAEEGDAKRLRVVIPPPALCVDNGAMIAGCAFEMLRRGSASPLDLPVEPNRPLGA